MWRLIYSVPLWVIFFLFRTLLIAFGWILIPLAAACKAYTVHHDENKKAKGENPIVYHFSWKWMWIYDNWEDGIANDMYEKKDSLFKQILYWSAMRNPVNNLRLVKYLSCSIEPKKVRWVGSKKPVDHFDIKPQVPEWFFAWHGVYVCIWWQYRFFGLRRLWVGWKIFPSDTIKVTGHRVKGAGFTSRIFQGIG